MSSDPTFIRIRVRDARPRLAEMIDRCQREGVTFIITKHGKDIAWFQAHDSIPDGHTPHGRQETAIEREFVKKLVAAGHLVRRQVKAQRGRADIVIYDEDGQARTVIEVKQSVLSKAAAGRAVAQVTRYAKSLGATQAFVVAPSIDQRFLGPVLGVRICLLETFLSECCAHEPTT